ncbi:hypothetical protein EB796_001037 [Bugula neritina]|uniref:SRA1/Sec31 domain-containing protein n=1 Tax=Bugula neritina TaxID=10212 RepID=A0A7J7KQW0_BUGNE|nr:hypothetical protein EB796_001165 [Bugula neritina]KAF6040624.1 hypothetical protein EB796_001037 [Bugula neritina]
MKLANDITKRIKIFQQSWTSGKISAKAKPNCARLCRALELEEYAAAHDIHLQLMTDHVSEVSQWMVGIKKMIQAGNSS